MIVRLEEIAEIENKVKQYDLPMDVDRVSQAFAKHYELYHAGAKLDTTQEDYIKEQLNCLYQAQYRFYKNGKGFN